MLNKRKLFYTFGDPFGSPDSKIGVTSNPEVRLGVYQNSYSKKSHTACFDIVYIGPARAIDNLEKAVKQEFNWEIERDGRGHSEWVSMDFKQISSIIDEIIDGYRFKIIKIPSNLLPLTVDNYEKFKGWLEKINE
jgi:T5orf172 domain